MSKKKAMFFKQEVVVADVYPTGQADSFGTGEANSIGLWIANGGVTTRESVAITDDGNSGIYAIRITSGDGSVDSAKIQVTGLEIGATYAVSVYSRVNAISSQRIALQDGFNYGTWFSATYSLIWNLNTVNVIPTTTEGNIWIYPAYTGGTAGDYMEIGYITVIKQ